VLDETLHPRQRAVALYEAGINNAELGNRKQATAQLEEARALFRKANDSMGNGWSLTALGNVHAWAGDYQTAEGPLRESVAIHEQMAARSVPLLHSLIGLGNVVAGQGDYQEGSRLVSLALQMNEEFKDIWGTLGAQLYLASTWRRLGDYTEAETWARRCLTLSQEVGASVHAAWCLLALGEIMKDQGRFVDAASCFEKAQRLDQRTDDPRQAAGVRLGFGSLALLQGDYAVAEANFAHDLGWFEEHENVSGIVTALDGLGHVACQTGNLVSARDRFGRALRTALACKARPWAHRVAAGIALWLSKTGQPLRAVELLGRIRSDSATERSTHAQRIDPLLAELEKVLPPDELAAALERGKAFDLEALRDELSGNRAR
jgi:tetratricopeptide (TPR) repeat protein